jgi:hypothetical protein
MAIHSSSKHWTPSVNKAAREVDAKFPRPEWTFTYPEHGENSSVGAYAVDFMCSKAKGDAIFAYMRKHRKRLGVRYLIWDGWWINWGTDGDDAKLKPYFNRFAVNKDGSPNPSKRHTNHVHASFETWAKYVPEVVPVTMYARELVKGYSEAGKVKFIRKPGRKLTGVIQEGKGGKYLVTRFGTWYPLERLTSKADI